MINKRDMRGAYILRAPNPDGPKLLETLTVNSIRLTGEQRSAVSLALSSRLSLILGAPGLARRH